MSLSTRACAATAAVLLAISLEAAGAFSAIVGPPRFELRADRGAVLRQSLSVGTDGLEPARYSVKTADWDFTPDGNAVFREGEPAPGSCRPWVRLERRELRVAPGQPRKFRFEVHVPADAPVGECRFALLIEGQEPSDTAGGTIRIPLQGRIAVIVYVAVGGARPDLKVKSIQTSTFNGRLYPSITFDNPGNAHGRPEGAVEARDASGKLLEFSISNSPVLPRTTRTLPFWPNEVSGATSPAIIYPLRLKGVIEWEGGKYEVDTVVRP